MINESFQCCNYELVIYNGYSCLWRSVTIRYDAAERCLQVICERVSVVHALKFDHGAGLERAVHPVFYAVVGRADGVCLLRVDGEPRAGSLIKDLDACDCVTFLMRSETQSGDLRERTKLFRQRGCTTL